MKRILRRVYRWVVPEPIPPCDAETLSVLGHVLRRDSNAVDVGCNRGSILQEMVRLAPQGRHFAFEPIPGLYRRLCKSFPGVTCHQLALSDADGLVTFNHFERMDGFSGMVRRQIGPDPGPVKELSVRTAPLDAVLPPDLPIAVIKIDVEGAEYRVLQGAQRTLRDHRPVVIFECGKGGLDLYGHAPEQVYDLLVDCGLNVRLLADWSPGRRALSRQEFVDEFQRSMHYMFVASPEPSGARA
jgi:FkbM family methyltransferase